MSRPLPLEFPGGAVYHVASRGNARQDIVADDIDRRLVGERYGWLCHAYCVMDNHYRFAAVIRYIHLNPV
jgi:putative transposase